MESERGKQSTKSNKIPKSKGNAGRTEGVAEREREAEREGGVGIKSIAAHF